MAESIPLFDPGNTYTGYAQATVVGSRFLAIAGPRSAEQIAVQHADGTKPVIGVSMHDAAAGDTVGVHHSAAIVTRVEAGAAFTAGAPLKSDSTGRAIAQGGTGTIVGSAIEDSSGAGALVLVDREAR